MTGPMTYTIEEAARLCGVSRGVGYEAARRGELPTIRLGRTLLVPKIALERMLGITGDERPEAGLEALVRLRRSPGRRATVCPQGNRSSGRRDLRHIGVILAAFIRKLADEA